MIYRKAILVLICACLVSCSNSDKQESELTKGEIFIQTCYNEKIGDNKLSILEDNYVFENYLIENKLLSSRDKTGYLNLMDSLLNGNADIDLHDFLEKNGDSHLMYEPSNIGMNKYCWEKAKGNHPTEMTIVFISDKLDTMSAMGDLGNWTINKDLIEGIPDACYSKNLYRIPLNTLLYGIASYKGDLKKRVN